MEIKSKSLDGVNEITHDTKTGITTTTLVHTFKPCIDLYDGDEHIAHYETDKEFIEYFKKMKQQNQKYKEAISKLNEMNADNYNKYCEELKKNIELKKQLNELKEIEKDHQILNGELREELKKCI